MSKKTKKTSNGARILAIFMLVAMLISIAAAMVAPLM